MSTSTISQQDQQLVSILVRAKPRTWELKGMQRRAMLKENSYMEESIPVHLKFKTNLPEPPSMEAWKQLVLIKDQIRMAFNEHHVERITHDFIHAENVTCIWVIWGDLNHGGSFSGLNIFDFRNTLELLAKAGPGAYLVFDFTR